MGLWSSIRIKAAKKKKIKIKRYSEQLTRWNISPLHAKQATKALVGQRSATAYGSSVPPEWSAQQPFPAFVQPLLPLVAAQGCALGWRGVRIPQMSLTNGTSIYNRPRKRSSSPFKIQSPLWNRDYTWASREGAPCGKGSLHIYLNYLFQHCWVKI